MPSPHEILMAENRKVWQQHHELVTEHATLIEDCRVLLAAYRDKTWPDGEPITSRSERKRTRIINRRLDAITRHDQTRENRTPDQ